MYRQIIKGGRTFHILLRILTASPSDLSCLDRLLLRQIENSFVHFVSISYFCMSKHEYEKMVPATTARYTKHRLQHLSVSA
jgi:hypothetical protein